jgi:hypothetical protein
LVVRKRSHHGGLKRGTPTISDGHDGVATFQNRSVGVRRRLLDVFEPQVAEIFERLPKIRSTRLAEILRDRGYEGNVYQVRRRLRELRRRGGAACYLRVVVFPGDQGQCDWGHFGTMTVGRAKRKLSCFAMVLSYSRRLFAAFTLDQTLESFLRSSRRRQNCSDLTTIEARDAQDAHRNLIIAPCSCVSRRSAL